MPATTTRVRPAPREALLAALDRPETAYSLSYRLGVDAQDCQRWLEALVHRGVVVRTGGPETAVYVRTEHRRRKTADRRR